MQRLVALVSVKFDRMFHGQGAHIKKFVGASLQIGKARTVAIEFEIDQKTHFVLSRDVPQYAEKLAV